MAGDNAGRKETTTFKTVSEESKPVWYTVTGWWETSLPTLLSNYELKNIHNADEIGLFYQYLQINKSEKCSGVK